MKEGRQAQGKETMKDQKIERNILNLNNLKKKEKRKKDEKKSKKEGDDKKMEGEQYLKNG